MEKTPKLFDVCGLGNALIDLEIAVTDAFLESKRLEKGRMSLVSEKDQKLVLDALDAIPRQEAAGGSAANTMVGVSLLGGKSCYIGKTATDGAGRVYQSSMSSTGVAFDVAPISGTTGTCLVLVTPDGERTMQSHLGCSTLLTASDIQPTLISSSHILYIEGYLLGEPNSAAVVEHAMNIARASNVPIALTLSDPMLVHQVLKQVRHIAKKWVDIIFCNEYEAYAYTGFTDREKAIRRINQDVNLVFVTCGADGSLVCRDQEIQYIKGHQVPVLDTTGAGDNYAAGALYCLTHNMSPIQAGILGSFLSAKVVKGFGPRLQESMAHLIPDILGGAHP